FTVQVLVESVSKWPWNECPSQRGISVHVFVEWVSKCARNTQHWIKHGHLDIQLDQGGQAIDGFSEVDGLWVEIDFFDFGVGTHHERLAPERFRELSIGDQVGAWNVGLVRRLQPTEPAEQALKHAPLFVFAGNDQVFSRLGV
ncbi:hypothetical protein, partial [Pseudomonas sp. 3A(2025)]